MYRNHRVVSRYFFFKKIPKDRPCGSLSGDHKKLFFAITAESRRLGSSRLTSSASLPEKKMAERHPAKPKLRIFDRFCAIFPSKYE